MLSDGQPVAGATIRARCPTAERQTRTDVNGRFVLSGLIEGSCELSCPGTRLREVVRLSANLLAEGGLRLVFPPMHRVRLRWREAGAAGALELDESLVQPVALSGRRLRVDRGRLVVDDRPTEGALVVGRRWTLGGLELELQRVERRAWWPLSLRGAPRGDERVLLRVPRGLISLRDALGRRTLLVVARCDQLRDEWRADVAAYTARHAGIGLRGAVVVVDACRAGHPGDVWGAGEELLWALDAEPGQVLLLGAEGRVLGRWPAQRTGVLRGAAAYLEGHWPPLAARRRVTLATGASVRRAEAERLLSRARVSARGGRLEIAHELLERVLRLAPDSAEAHRERALTKARLGDLSGALAEIAWWRSAFGDLAAEELEDQVQQRARYSGSSRTVGGLK